MNVSGSEESKGWRIFKVYACHTTIQLESCYTSELIEVLF